MNSESVPMEARLKIAAILRAEPASPLKVMDALYMNAMRGSVTAQISDQVRLMDDLRGETVDFFHDLKDGVNVWDALTNAADDFSGSVFNWAAHGLTEKLFGEMGDTASGSSWIDALAGFFGGGKATGGWAMPNTVRSERARHGDGDGAGSRLPADPVHICHGKGHQVGDLSPLGVRKVEQCIIDSPQLVGCQLGDPLLLLGVQFAIRRLEMHNT